MSFQPNVGDVLTIEGVSYRFVEHPATPWVPDSRQGRQSVVYQLAVASGSEPGYRALKVFEPCYRIPGLVSLADRFVSLANVPGLQVCERTVLSTGRHEDLLRQHPDLAYAVLMPWIEGPTWMDVLLHKGETAWPSLTPQQSLTLARSLARILTGLEERSLAHCDLSGANVLLPGLLPAADLATDQPIALVDMEQLYGPGLERPTVSAIGSPGYLHPQVPEGARQPEADRFAGTVLLAEILGWCDERVRAVAWGESYFDPQEMQQVTERYSLLRSVLREHWGKGVASLLKRAWRSDALTACPTFAEWLLALPDKLPAAITLTPPETEAAPPSPEASNIAVRALVDLAHQLQKSGNMAGALLAYRQAQTLARADSELVQEMTWLVHALETAPAPPEPVPATVEEPPYPVAIAPARPIEPRPPEPIAPVPPQPAIPAASPPAVAAPIEPVMPVPPQPVVLAPVEPSPLPPVGSRSTPAREEGSGVRPFSPLPVGEGPGAGPFSPLPVGEGPGVRSESPSTLVDIVPPSPPPRVEEPAARVSPPPVREEWPGMRVSPLPVGEGPGMRFDEPPRKIGGLTWLVLLVLGILLGGALYFGVVTRHSGQISSFLSVVLGSPAPKQPAVVVTRQPVEPGVTLTGARPMGTRPGRGTFGTPGQPGGPPPGRGTFGPPGQSGMPPPGRGTFTAMETAEPPTPTETETALPPTLTATRLLLTPAATATATPAPKKPGATATLARAAATRKATPGGPTVTPTATPVPPTPTVPPTETATAAPAHALGETSTRPTDSMVMVYVPAGEFQMGSSEANVDAAMQLCAENRGNCKRESFAREQPAHPVALSGFWLDRTEVTNTQYAAFLNAQGNQKEEGAFWLNLETGDSLIERVGEKFQPKNSYAEHPAVHVSWFGAAAYCKWAGGRLPTEAEWEHAARGPQSRMFPWGDKFGDKPPVNYWATSDGYSRTAPVGSFPEGASWCGALDLAGNVMEWVADWYSDYAGGRQTDPSGPDSGILRVMRGGSWAVSPVDVRGANRGAGNPSDSTRALGFRCAQSTP